MLEPAAVDAVVVVRGAVLHALEQPVAVLRSPRHLFICAEQLVKRHFSHAPSAVLPEHTGHCVAAQSPTSAAVEIPAWLFVKHACPHAASPGAQACEHATSAPHEGLSKQVQ